MTSPVSGFVPYEMKTSILRITGYDSHELSGTLKNPYFPKEMFFSNVVQLLMLMDEMLDSLNYPQRANEVRSFKSSPSASRALPATEEQLALPALASFNLNVLFRQNSSWQGRLVWIEEKSEAQFRSVLELIMLMDNVLS